jgi:pimeloyl-ACP methyl ester carboxylesterase
MKKVLLFFAALSLSSCVTNTSRKLASAKEIPFVLTNNGYSLSGQINEVEGSKDVAIFFHGSGVHDRWETIPSEVTLTKNPEPFFKPISEELNKRGISTVVFDKRAFPEKDKPEFEKVLKTFNFENIKSDASSVVDYISKTGKYDKIILIGHSEGTVTASEIAFDLKNDKRIYKLVLIGVLAVNLKASLQHQYTTVMADNAFAAADKNKDGKIYPEEVPDSLKPGLPINKIDKDNKGYITYSDLMSVLEIQVKGLFKAIKDAPSDALISNKPVQWYRDLFDRKTLLERANEFEVTTLIVHGELDQNVPFKTNALALNSKLSSLKRDVVLKSFPKYGHGLSPEKDGLPTLGPIQSDAVQAITNWISYGTK